MKLFKPQLQLARESEMQADGSFRNHYYLHVVTFTDQTSYRPSEEDTVVETSSLESDGLVKVRLYAYRDTSLESFRYLTPVVHFVDLGTPVEKGRKFTVQVDFFKDLSGRDPGTGNGEGSSQTGSSGADEDGRPIGG